MGEASGNGAKAAELAGVPKTSARVWASNALDRERVVSEIERLQTEINNNPPEELANAIADATERRVIITRKLRGEDNSLGIAKLVDVLNKMDGIYIQKHQHELKTSLVDLLAPEGR